MEETARSRVVLENVLMAEVDSSFDHTSVERRYTFIKAIYSNFHENSVLDTHDSCMEKTVLIVMLIVNRTSWSTKGLFPS